MATFNLPHSEQEDVNVNVNETPDTATLNRNFNRLLSNDTAIRDIIETILNTEISDGLIGSIGDLLQVDETYLEQLIIDILNGEGTPYNLNSLSDVLIENLSHGDILTYDITDGLWKNGGADTLPPLQSVFIRDNSYLDNITHDVESIAPIFNTDTNPQTYTYTYDATKFNNDGTDIDPNNIAGFLIKAQLFGRIDDNDSEGLGGADWIIKASYPDGNSYNILKYHAQNIDDDGGIGTTIFVPFDYDQTVDFTIEVTLANHNSSLVDGDGIPLNYFKIENVIVDSNISGLSPDVETVLINGSVPIDDVDILSNGYLDFNSNTDPVYQAWTSASGDYTTYISWANIVPINIPGRTNKTEIEFENYLILNGAVTGDPGATTGSVGTAKGTVFIDWVTGTVTGSVNFYNGSEYDLIGSGVLVDTTNGVATFTTTPGILGNKDIKVAISTTRRGITGLPVVVDVDNNIALGKVNYTIKHYNIIGISDFNEGVSFCGTTTVDQIAHGLGVVPDYCTCFIDEGNNGTLYEISKYFEYTQQNNGTDGGLKYRFKIPFVYADDTNIYIDKRLFNSAPSGSFPSGTRHFTATICG